MDFASVEEEYAAEEARMLGHCGRLSERGLPGLVSKVAVVLYSHFYQDISLEDVAEEVGVNKIYLGRVFREWTGSTVLDLLISIRMHHARFLLERSDLMVAEIARLLGYQDPGYFSRLFKKREGSSPEKFRNEHPGRQGEGDPLESALEIRRRFIGLSGN